MNKGLMITFLLLLFILLHNAYALEDNTSVYVEGVQMYNIFLAKKPIFLNDSIDYTKAYLRVLSYPTTRGEYLASDLLWDARLNDSKLKEIETIMQKDKRGVIKISRGIFTFKDQPDYEYVVRPWGIHVNYVIREGKKITIEEFHEERRKFLNETTTRLKELDILWKYNLRWKKRYDPRYKTETCIALVYIDEVSNLSNHTFQQLMKGANYTVVKESDKDVITLYSNDSKYWDVIFIKDRWSIPVLDWYGYLAFLEYNEDKTREIKNKLDLIEQNLDNIQRNLSNISQNSSELELLLNNLMSIREELYSLKEEIDSLDAFVKISEESLRRPHAKWLEELFEKDIKNETVYSLGTRVSRLNSKYNFLELERKDLFDITVAMYSTTLQRENFSKQIKLMVISIIISILAALGVGQYLIARRLTREQIRKMDEQIQEMKKLTDKQIKASRENIKTLVEEIGKLKQKEG